MIGLGLSLTPGATGSLGAGAGPAPPITGGRMALAGDSFAANNLSAPGANSFTTYQSGFEVMLECLSGGKFQFVPGLQKGVAGRRSDEVLSAFAAEIAPGAALFDLGTVNVGRNDVTQTGLLTTAQSITNIKAICQAFLDLGKPVLLWLPNPPRSDSTLDANSAIRAAQRQMMADVNDAMRGWSKPGVHLVDFEAAWNAGGGVPNGNFTYDACIRRGWAPIMLRRRRLTPMAPCSRAGRRRSTRTTTRRRTRSAT